MSEIVRTRLVPALGPLLASDRKRQDPESSISAGAVTEREKGRDMLPGDVNASGGRKLSKLPGGMYMFSRSSINFREMKVKPRCLGREFTAAH